MDGISFFPHYVVPDDSIRLVHAKFGIAGYGVVFKLFERIFSQGFYTDWNEDICALFAADCLLSSERVEPIVQYALEKKVFDKLKFDQYNILTSARIQREFFFAARARETLDIVSEYLLVDIDEILCSDDAEKASKKKNVKAPKQDLFSEYLIAKESERCEEFVRENGVLCPWLEQFDYMVILYAFSICIRKERKNIDYLFGILGNWKKNGYTSLDDVDDPILSVPKFLKGAPEYSYNSHINF